MKYLLLIPLIYLLCGAAVILVTMFIEFRVGPEHYLPPLHIFEIFFVWPIIVADCYIPFIKQIIREKRKGRESNDGTEET